MTQHQITIQSVEACRGDETLKKLASNVLVAKALAESLRKQVDDIASEVLKQFTLTISPEFSDMFNEHGVAVEERIFDPQRAYLAKEADWEVFHQMCLKKHAEVGIKPVGNPEFCPALEAETLLNKFENEMLDRAAKILGMPSRIYIGERRKLFVDIILRLHVNG